LWRIELRKKREDNDNDDDNDEFWIDDGCLKLISQNATYKTIKHVGFIIRLVLSMLSSKSIEPPKLLPLLQKKVFETKNDDGPSLETSIREALQTQGHKILYSQLDPLGQKYVSALLNDDKRNKIDHVYISTTIFGK